MSGDPYQRRVFSNNPFVKKTEVTGRLVVVLDGLLEDRGLQLIVPISRAIQKHEIHELILTDEEQAGPGSSVQRIAYLGFMEVLAGGVIVAGDMVYVGGQLLGELAGFDETHLPNHLNIVIKVKHRVSGAGLDLALGETVVFRKARSAPAGAEEGHRA